MKKGSKGVVSPLEPFCGSGSKGSEGSKGSKGVVSPSAMKFYSQRYGIGFCITGGA